METEDRILDTYRILGTYRIQYMDAGYSTF